MILASALLLAPVPAAAAAPPAAKPNILVIVSDDHGYADVGFHGCKDIPTPHLDRLAGEGVRCTNGYASHPYCSPTRAGIMTGRYQQRFGHERNPYYDPNDTREGLPTSEKLLPGFLRDAGYVTGWIGKWHLGAAPVFRPENRGFTETFGFIGGHHRFHNWKPDVRRENLLPIERNGKAVEVAKHLTLAFGDESEAFIRRHRNDPWFLYLAFNAPHTPNEPTAERLEKFSSIQDPTRRSYAAQVSLLDDAIGQTMDALRQTGQDRRTLVFFFSDNGGPIGKGGNGSQNTPLREGKGDVFEGGIRVPFVVSWPGVLPAGTTYDHPVVSFDVFASALGAAGVNMPDDRKYDSVDLVPFLTGKNKDAPHRHLFWRSGSRLAARDLQGAKIVRRGKSPQALYQLDADIAESTDLSALRGDDAKRLASELDAWNKELVPPAFPGLGARRAAAKPPPKTAK